MGIFSFLSSLVIPAVVLLCGISFLFGRGAGTRLGLFMAGAKQGLRTAAGLIPTLCLLMAGIAMFGASGAPELLARACQPVTDLLRIPPQILPLVFTRPFSGSASLAQLNDIFAQYGADSYIGRCASLIMGSTDSFVYIFAVYFAAAGVKRSRWAMPTAVLTQVFCVIFCCWLAGRWF